MQPGVSLTLFLKLNHLLHSQPEDASLVFVAIKGLHKKVNPVLSARDA